jgi:hypothetical protein
VKHSKTISIILVKELTIATKKEELFAEMCKQNKKKKKQKV